MSSWSKRRKTLYTAIVVVVVVGVVIVPGFLYLYNPPTCTDGKQNGNEQGIDCGGSCQRLCQSAFLPATIAWTRFENVAPELYNLAAYIINPNTTGEAARVPYHFVLYDDRGVLITDQAGTVTLPPHRNTLAFAGAVNVGKRTPAKALFEFTSAPDWHARTDPLGTLAIGDKKYSEDTRSSSLEVSMKNTGLQPLPRMAVYSILYDAENNALGFSKTFVDALDPQTSSIAPFTWPVNREGKVISIEVLPVAE